jgi:hypothetical protein
LSLPNIRHTIDFTPHADNSKVMDKNKLVRYQVNPTKNWGPGSRPKNVVADEPMGDPTGTAAGGPEELQELGLAVDPVEYPPGAEVVEPGAMAAEVEEGAKRSRVNDEDERDAKKIKLDDEEAALNM